MFRFFSQGDEVENAPEPAPSLYDQLSTAIGWLNPFSYSPSSVRSSLISTTLLLGAIAPEVSARICFQAFNPLKYYTLSCFTYFTQENNLYKFLQRNCSIYQSPYYECGDSEHPYVRAYFGSGMFGGEACSLASRGWPSNVPPQCVTDVLNQHVRSGYGTPIDRWATVGLVTGGVVVVSAAVVAGVFLFRHYRRTHTREIKFIELYDRLNSLGVNEETAELRKQFCEFEDNYKCPVSLEIMEYPTTLDACKHNFEMDIIKRYFNENENCPCCRDDKTDPDEISVNKALQNEIETKLGKLEESLIELEVERLDSRRLLI